MFSCGGIGYSLVVWQSARRKSKMTKVTSASFSPFKPGAAPQCAAPGLRVSEANRFAAAARGDKRRLDYAA
jgi:hypothetical protein